MRLLSLCATALALTACSMNSDRAGQVSGFDERGRLTVVGPKQFGGDPKPSKRMIEQANKVCPGAEYLEARPSTADFNLYEYEFRC